MNGAESRAVAVPAPCQRARARAALAPDGELSVVEAMKLRAHLRACADCAAFSDDVWQFTATLRLESRDASG